ncbi:hypothetical protein JL720_17199 [Aureococcus anophagefferens]|nr:hypothetical protein JL720_17199 [Aureococcus anophagefferens]
MPKWCGEAWHFERQAALSGASSVTVCAGAGADDGARFRWAHRAWLQGPWATKDADFAVDADRFDAGVAAALGAVGGPPASATVAADDENVHRCPADGPRDAARPRERRRHRGRARRRERAREARRRGRPARAGAAEDRSAFLNFDAGALELCVAEVDALDAAACFRASAFNEFSTLDVTVPWGERLAVAVWLRGAGGAAADVDLRRRLLQQGLPAVRTSRWTSTAPTAASGCRRSRTSRRRAAPRAAARRGAAGAFEVRDWRLFAETCDVLEVPVQIDGRPVVLAGTLGHATALQGELSAFCGEHALNPAACGPRRRGAAARRAARGGEAPGPARGPAPADGAPAVPVPPPREGGGLVAAYASSAPQRRLAFYVPCYDAAGTYWEDYRCYAFDVANASAVTAGRAPARGARGPPVGRLGRPRVLRRGGAAALLHHGAPPVDRAVSLYYERVYQRDDIGGGVNDLPLGEFSGSCGPSRARPSAATATRASATPCARTRWA